MKITPLRHCLPCLFCGMFTALFVLAAIFAAAQPSPRVASALNASVHLNLGATTLARVVGVLSEQTGIKVEAVAYLQTRNIVIEMDDLSARSALDALCELNDWTWHETVTGSVIISRPRLQPLADAGDVSKAMKAALSKDFRRYFGVGVPSGEMVPRPNKLVLLPGLTPLEQEEEEARARIDYKLRSVFGPNRDFLLSSLEPDLSAGKEIPYKQLTVEQREALLLPLVIRATFDRSMDALRGKLMPYQRDSNLAELQIRRNMLMVGSSGSFGKDGGHLYAGFGSPLERLFPAQQPDPQQP